MKKKKNEYIGWESSDGNLKIIEIIDGSVPVLCKVKCKICSQDNELFPEGYFIVNLHNVTRGHKPCGCSKSVKWNKDQWLILAKRASRNRSFVVKDYAEKFHGYKTKVLCECLIDGSEWTPLIRNIISGVAVCQKCKSKAVGDRCRTPENTAKERCDKMCLDKGYIPLGFPNGYINNRSRFEYICPKHGKQNVRYNNFVINKRSCRYCGLESRREIGKTYGRYTNRSEEKDFLYILNFGEKYIKVGRSFNIKSRISSLKSESGISDIRVIAVYSSLHKNIYKIEQKIHDELRSNNYDYLSANWSTEIFKNECVELLYKIIGKYENEGALINESFLYLY